MRRVTQFLQYCCIKARVVVSSGERTKSGDYKTEGLNPYNPLSYLLLLMVFLLVVLPFRIVVSLVDFFRELASFFKEDIFYKKPKDE